MYEHICPGCGAHLDPGEPCEDCRAEKERRRERTEKISGHMEKMVRVGKNGQMQLIFE